MRLHTQCSWEFSLLAFFFFTRTGSLVPSHPHLSLSSSFSFAPSLFISRSLRAPPSFALCHPRVFFTYLWIWWLCCCFIVSVASLSFTNWNAWQSIPNKLVAQDVQAGILNNIETFDTHTIMSFQTNAVKSKKKSNKSNGGKMRRHINSPFHSICLDPHYIHIAKIWTFHRLIIILIPCASI